MKIKFFNIKYLVFFTLIISGFLIFNFASAASPSDYGLKEGDLISAIFSDDPDVYIVNDSGYKRLFLNPEIFNFYGHLGGFVNVKLVTPEVRDAFPTSGLFRNCEINDEKVYGLKSIGEDTGTLHWVNTSGIQAVTDDSNFFKKVFCINNKEFSWYPKGTYYDSVNKIPTYVRIIKSIPTSIVNPAIKVLSPNGGEKYYVGDTIKIRWKRNWMPTSGNSLVDVYYYRTSTGVYRLLVGGVNDSSGLDFQITSDLLGYGDDFKISVTSRGFGGSAESPLSDDSDAVFIITEKQTPPVVGPITVLSPNGGEKWELESKQLIKWTSAPTLLAVPHVDIELLRTTVCFMDPCPLAPSFSSSIAKKVANNGSFSWTVGESISGSAISAGSSYIVRVTDSDNTNQYDDSDSTFIITEKQSENLPPVVKSITGPSVLKVDEVGKWEIKATDPEQGTLSYSVIWGDETGTVERMVSVSPYSATQTATFTHTYSKVGTYVPVFKVTDDGGLSAKTSISVNVKEDVIDGTTNTINKPPVITSVPSVPSDIKVGEQIWFSFSASDADRDNLSWSISWGDGAGVAQACQSPNPQNSKGWSFSSAHIWQSVGTYAVKVTVSDCRGGSATYKFSVKVVH